MAMEALSSSLTLPTISFRLNNCHQLSPKIAPLNAKTRFPTVLQNHLNFSLYNSSIPSSKAQVTASPSFVSSSSTTNNNNHWMVLMAKPPEGVNSKPQIIDYYVNTLKTVLGSEKDAQMCIYDASCDTHFGFCCSIDEQASLELARLPEVLSVKPDPDYNSNTKDYTASNIGNLQLFPSGNTKHWLVRMDKPGIGVVTKAQMVDYYTQILTKVLGNEQDAQMCIYNVSWQSQFSFCCELDEECANELTGVPGVLSVELDRNFESENKDHGGNSFQNSTSPPETLEASETPPVRTKKLFITGLSFYTSEKTLRSHFEGFGELVEVKIIMDKISKRSKGYAFVEYTTEEAASAALKEMNGKIINGWMIVVDVAKTKPQSFSRGRPRPTV